MSLVASPHLIPRQLPSTFPPVLLLGAGLEGGVSFFRSEYLTQEEALHHHDGVTMICYIIKYGVSPDERLSWVLEGINRVQEAQTNTRIGPLPMSRLLPMFFEDYFLYWGTLETVKDEKYVIKWLVPRTTLFASLEQMNEFRRLWGPWDEPNLRNYRPLQERGGRHVFFINPHWAQYNSLLPISRIPEPSISVLSPAYRKNSWMLPPQNRTNDAEGFHFEAGLKSSSSRCLQKTI